MGIFDKLKSAANFITGGSAKVSLEIIGNSVSTPIMAKITVLVGEKPLSYESAYLQIRCVEVITETVSTEGGEEKETEDNVLYEAKIEMANAGLIDASKEISFNKEIVLPENSVASIVEENRSVSWEFYAGLDVKGNDPDSGWKTVILN